MIKIILHRLLLSIPLLFAVTFVTFFLNSFAPTDLARTILGVDGTPEQYEAMREKLGLNRSVIVQYGSWLAKVLQGDLGISFFTNERVLTDESA
jgi:peptide/nickel transport system permease protein